jgi:hypothetical protein
MRRKSKYALKKKSQTMKKSVKKYLSAKNQIEFRDLEEDISPTRLMDVDMRRKSFYPEWDHRLGHTVKVDQDVGALGL